MQAGKLTLIAHVDNIDRDAAGLARYHYTILDFAAAWAGVGPVAGDDVTEAVFAEFSQLARFALWSEAERVIALAREKILA